MARQGWKEALALIPQVAAFEDPRLAVEAAPLAVGSPHGLGQVVRVSQRVEWPGKRDLRGAMARAEAQARASTLEQVQLDLALVASLLFDDHFVVHRQLVVNQEHAALVAELKTSAEARYAVGQGSQQDPLQAEAEGVALERERLVLLARGRVVVAQINGLLHRDATVEIPPPPGRLPEAGSPGQEGGLAQSAFAMRPELQEVAHRLEGAAQAVDLADRMAFPDFVFSGTYNSMWPELEHRFMLGLALQVPVQQSRVQGRRDQASAARARLQMERAARLDEVGVEVEQARVALEESFQVLSLLEHRLLPVTRSRVEAAQAAYETGRGSFGDWMDAQRRLRTVEGELDEALANTWRCRAQLDRAVGTVPLAMARGGAK